MSVKMLTNSEKIERYKRKIEKLEKESAKSKRRRRIVLYSDDSEDEQGGNHADSSPPPSSNNVMQNLVEMESQPNISEDSVAVPSLDPALLAALGEPSSDTPEFGPDIHETLANMWPPLLKKGLTKENKEKLLKQHLVPSNCKLLQAPKLNAEISSAVSEVVRGRDKKYVAVQQQLGQGIATVNRGMEILLQNDDKIQALAYFSDAGRILSDLHNFFTKERVKLLTPTLDKNFLHVIQDAERDETLFGNTLSEKIKASKAIEKQGQQIKKNSNVSRPNTSSSSTNTRPFSSQGNWSGPPRYSSVKGGRGGSRKTNPSPATRRPYHSTAAQTKMTQNKPRAQTQQ